MRVSGARAAHVLVRACRTHGLLCCLPLTHGETCENHHPRHADNDRPTPWTHTHTRARVLTGHERAGFVHCDSKTRAPDEFTVEGMHEVFTTKKLMKQAQVGVEHRRPTPTPSLSPSWNGQPYPTVASRS